MYNGLAKSLFEWYFYEGASLATLGTGLLVSVAVVAVVAIAIYVVVTIIIKANEEVEQYETQ